MGEEKREFEEVGGGTVWQFEKEGDNIEGELVDIVAGQYGNNYVLKAPSDEEFTVFGGTVLNTKFAKIEKGKYVKITYIGEVKSQSGRTYKDFKVEVAK